MPLIDMTNPSFIGWVLFIVFWAVLFFTAYHILRGQRIAKEKANSPLSQDGKSEKGNEFDFKKPAIATLLIFAVAAIVYVFFKNIDTIITAVPFVVFKSLVWGACLVIAFCAALIFFNRDKSGVRYKLLPAVGNVFGVSLIVAMVSMMITLFKALATSADIGLLHVSAMFFFIIAPSAIFICVSRDIESTNP